MAVEPTATCAADLAPCKQGNKTTELPAYFLATLASSGQAVVAGTTDAMVIVSTMTSRLSEGSSAEAKSRIGRDNMQSNMVRTLLGNGVAGVGSVNATAGSRQEQLPQDRDQFHWGSSVANPDAIPILDNVVELLVENQAQPNLVCEHTLLEYMSTQRSKVTTTLYTLTMCHRIIFYDT